MRRAALIGAVGAVAAVAALRLAAAETPVAARTDAWDEFIRGRALFARVFTPADGAGAVVDALISGDGMRVRAPGVTSCAQCHNAPGGDAGPGPTVAMVAPGGRNTPHLFGAGLVEALARDVEGRLTALVDRDGDGVIARAEASGRATITAGDGRAVDFGDFADRDGDGRPDLDPILHLWLVDADGRRLPARSFADAQVAGYRLVLQPFGWSHGERRALPDGASLRAVAVGAFAAHAGVQACDAALAAEPRGDGWATTPRSGAAQPYAGQPPDRGLRRDQAGLSLDDPDGDGICAELGADELDAIEAYLGHLPAPRALPGDDESRRGLATFTAIGCVGCHVPSWTLSAPDARLAWDHDGDAYGGATARPASGMTDVWSIEGIYSDLRTHDLGAGFTERGFDGAAITRFRTPPLWGVAVSAPYGHDGASPDLAHVIRRHGGEAQACTDAYASLDAAQRRALHAFLATLTLPRITP